MVSPPKPWERTAVATAQPINPDTSVPVTVIDSQQQQTPPERPSAPYSSMNNDPYRNNYTSSYNRYGSYNSPYSSYSTPYNSYSGYNSYSSPYTYGYNRYGNSYGANRYPPGMEDGYQSTFQILEQFVHAFGGLAQMLESTFMATQSSFMAMMGLAEQYTNLKQFLGDFLSIFAIYNYFKSSNSAQQQSSDFKNEFLSPAKKKPSKRPVLFFLIFLFGFPWLMHKLFQYIQSKQQKQLPSTAKVEFAKALFDFQGQSPEEISFKKNDIIGIISKTDPVTGQPSLWWRGKLQKGPIGYFPANYVEALNKTIEIPLKPLSDKSFSSIDSTPTVNSESLNWKNELNDYKPLQTNDSGIFTDEDFGKE